jgi:hypothetical protein
MSPSDQDFSALMSIFWMGPPAAAGHARNGFRRGFGPLCRLVLVMLLAGCSAGSAGKTGSVEVTGPQHTQEAIAPISAVPPGGGDRPLLPGQSGTQYTPDGLPALEPKGLNADQLFAEKLKDDKARIDRLERAVTDLRREFDAIKPSIIRLTAVEGDMQELLQQLQTLTNNPGAQTAAMPQGDVADTAAPVAAKPVTHAVAPQAPAGEKKTGRKEGLAVTAIRSGSRDGGARLVLDLTGPAQYTRDLDNGEHLLVIELSGAAWKAAASGSFDKNPLLQSWTAKPEDGGRTLLAIQLSGPAQIVYDKTLPGADGAGSRLVLDLRPGT